MAYTFNGMGTTFYGQRDFRVDGTHITTEWLVCFYVPLIPLRSLRVRYQGPGEHRWHLGFGSSENYAVYEKRFPPHWRQVLCTYGYVALLVAWVYWVGFNVAVVFPNALDNALSVALVFIACIIPVPTPWILRHYAEKRAYERHDA